MPIKQTVIGGFSRIMDGVFGAGRPSAIGGSSSPSQVGGDTRAEGGFYRLHEGATFLPGTGNWVFDPYYEGPLTTIWGNAFLRTPNTFKPIPSTPPAVYPLMVPIGIGGIVAGQIALQPLIESEP